jgi:hypothetical protein
VGDLQLRTNISNTFTQEKKKLTYPYIYIPRFGSELALIVECLAPGEVPIVLRHEGTLTQVGTCRMSALELTKLLRIYVFEVVLSGTEKRVIKEVVDIMEALPWMVSL